MSYFFNNEEEKIDIMQEILDKSVKLLFEIRKAITLQGDARILDIMQDLERSNQEIQQLIKQTNPELYKIITDPKNQSQSSFNLIKDYCERKRKENIR